jgi:hypothetical protein
VPRWKTPRWTLGAPALVALAVAGCGAAASQPRLHNTSEKRLLSLVTRARTDASNHDGSAVDADLGQFVSEVKTLTTGGQLSEITAGKLDREARATAAQAVHQLRQKAATKASTAATAVLPAGATTTPASATNPSPPAQNTSPRAQNTGPPVQNATQPAQQNNQVHGDEGSGTSPGPGHGHRHDNRHSGWSSSQGGAHQTSVAKAWAKMVELRSRRRR